MQQRRARGGLFGWSYLFVFLLGLEASAVKRAGDSDGRNSSGEDDATNCLLRHHDCSVDEQGDGGGAVKAERKSSSTAGRPLSLINSEAPGGKQIQPAPAAQAFHNSNNNNNPPSSPTH